VKAVLHTGGRPGWVNLLGRHQPWALLPLCNRPLLEYWLECCVNLGATEVCLVLGDGAEAVEHYAGDGQRWGLRIQYGFLRDETDPAAYLRRNPARWRDGLFFLSGPVFLRHTADVRPGQEGDLVYADPAANVMAVISRDGDAIERWIRGGALPPARGAPSVEPLPLCSVGDYFALNMRLAGGEIARYVTPGYFARDGSCVGYNVIIPASANLVPPLMIGNDCRICPLTTIGPAAIIGNRILVDRQSELSACVVLDNTYVGRNLEIRGKIAAGSRLIDPQDGAVMEFADPWILAGVRPAPRLKDFARAVAGGLVALALAAVLALPFAVLYPFVRGSGAGRLVRRKYHGRRGRLFVGSFFEPALPLRRSARLFHGLALDALPRLGDALRGRLWLCGQPVLASPEDDALHADLPECWPGAFSYADHHGFDMLPVMKSIDALLYSRRRSPLEDLALLATALHHRWQRMFKP